MNENTLLMLTKGGFGDKGVPGSIGTAGNRGFGVGIYPGEASELTDIGLKPMVGCEYPSHPNYGNYIHNNGSIMVFIPAFCYRIGNQSAPSYDIYKTNALEIRDASLGEGSGWIFHRAFIDGGVRKLGFFMDKYLCSKDPTGSSAISVKNGDSIWLNAGADNSAGMPDCKGEVLDAVRLGRARGSAYSCVTAFQWSAISMLSFAHGQASTSTQFCGWYDGTRVKNFPKGNNKNLSDIDDPSVKWTAHSVNANLGKTGSGTPFNKTTHNGQNCGITDVNGSVRQPLLGCLHQENGEVLSLKDSIKANSLSDQDLFYWASYDTSTIPSDAEYHWGDYAFRTGSTGTTRALCGVIPSSSHSDDTTSLFGNDKLKYKYGTWYVLATSGNYKEGKRAGIWYRSFENEWYYRSDYNPYGFRVAGYAK